MFSVAYLIAVFPLMWDIGRAKTFDVVVSSTQNMPFM